MWRQGVRVLKLGRWARKKPDQQLTADVHDPGYEQMHWARLPPGKARQDAIAEHYRRIERTLQGCSSTATKDA